MKPVAYIHTDFKEKFGIPRQSGRVPQSIAEIVFCPEYRSPDAVREIEGFSHLWLIFDFSKAHRDPPPLTVRPPRLGGNRRVGVFASRSPFRPNSLGLSSVRLLEVKKTQDKGPVLRVSGADLLDGTPIFDIKPYLPFTDCHPDAVGGYADEKSDYRLRVVIPEDLRTVLPDDKTDSLIGCLSEDPRPSYQDDENRVYSMLFSDFDVRFTVKGGTLTVKEIERVCK